MLFSRLKLRIFEKLCTLYPAQKSSCYNKKSSLGQSFFCQSYNKGKPYKAWKKLKNLIEEVLNYKNLGRLFYNFKYYKVFFGDKLIEVIFNKKKNKWNLMKILISFIIRIQSVKWSLAEHNYLVVIFDFTSYNFWTIFMSSPYLLQIRTDNPRIKIRILYWEIP